MASADLTKLADNCSNYRCWNQQYLVRSVATLSLCVICRRSSGGNGVRFTR